MGRLIGAPQPPGTARLSFPVRRASIERAHNVRPYTRFTEAFRLTGDGVLEVRWVLGGGPVRTPAPTGGLLEHPGGRRTARRVAAPYGDFRNNNITGKHGGLCRTTNSEATIKLRGQVEARQAERQRRFIAGLKTGGDALRIPSAMREPPPPRPKLAVNLRTSLPKLRRVLGFFGGSESGLCPPAGG